MFRIFEHTFSFYPEELILDPNPPCKKGSSLILMRILKGCCDLPYSILGEGKSSLWFCRSYGPATLDVSSFGWECCSIRCREGKTCRVAHRSCFPLADDLTPLCRILEGNTVLALQCNVGVPDCVSVPQVWNLTLHSSICWILLLEKLINILHILPL